MIFICICICFCTINILYRTERRKYYKHIHKARKYPDRYLSIILDGMDQKSTSIPRFYRTSKSASGAWKLPTHITGAIIHGKGQHMYLDNKDHPHDSNMTATILLNIIKKYSNPLPDVLYLQMDNCFRENKNQTIIGVCALLVEMEIFKKVKKRQIFVHKLSSIYSFNFWWYMNLKQTVLEKNKLLYMVNLKGRNTYDR